MQQDYQRALDAYDNAKMSLDAVTQPDEIKHVTEILEDGRYAIACVKARVAGEPLPAKRPPCFFNPAHGPSSQNVDWAPPGGVARDVPACPADAERVLAGADPYIRTVQVGAQRVPYWEGGPAYAPWAQGYYSRWSGTDMLSGMLIGSMLFGGMGNMFAMGAMAAGMDGGGGDVGGDGGGDAVADVGGGDGGGGGRRRLVRRRRRRLRLRRLRRRVARQACSPRLASGRSLADAALAGGSASRRRVSEQPASILSVARSSPRVGPRLMITTGRPALALCRTKRSPDITVSDEPSTTSTSAASTSAYAWSTRSRGTDSPKKTTSGFSRPPQSAQSASTKSDQRSTTASPSGRSSACSSRTGGGDVGVELGEPALHLDAAATWPRSPGRPRWRCRRAGRPPPGCRPPGAGRRRSG